MAKAARLIFLIFMIKKIIFDVRLTFQPGKNGTKISKFNKKLVFPDQNHIDRIPTGTSILVNLEKQRSGHYLACQRANKR